MSSIKTILLIEYKFKVLDLEIYSRDIKSIDGEKIKIIYVFNPLKNKNELIETLEELRRLYHLFEWGWVIVYPREYKELMLRLINENVLKFSTLPALDDSKVKDLNFWDETLRRDLGGLFVGKKMDLARFSFQVFQIKLMEDTMTTKGNLLKEITKLSQEEVEEIVSKIIETEELDGKKISQLRMARRMLNSIRLISDKLVTGSSTSEMLQVIIEGLIKMFGSKRVAVMICGFDESLPHYHQFIPQTYHYGGTDPVRVKNMESHGPPRPGRREGSSVATMELRRTFYFNDRNRPPEDTPPEMIDVLEHFDKELKSAAFLPLMLGAERVGIIQIQFADGHHFSATEKTEIGVYAQMAAITLYNVNLKRQIEDLKSMFVTLQGESQGENLDELVVKLTASGKYSDIYIASYNADAEIAKRLKVYRDGAFLEVSADDESHKSELSPLDRYVLDSSKTVFIPDKINETSKDMGIRLGFSRPPKCYLAVPITNQNGLQGILVVQDFEDENKLDASDKAIMERFANQLGRIM